MAGGHSKEQRKQKRKQKNMAGALARICAASGDSRKQARLERNSIRQGHGFSIGLLRWKTRADHQPSANVLGALLRNFVPQLKQLG
jgi:hypothetical protein